MTKKKTRIPLIAAAGFFVAEGIFLGYRYGIGPFQSLYDRHMRNLPGNSARYNMDGVERMESSPLTGKRVLFLGSSVTYGAASLQEGIPEYFAVRFGCKVTKEAVSGTTLVNDADSSYVHRLLHHIDPAEDYSLIVIQLSTNDATKKKPLGEIAEGYALSDFDTHTVTGALEYTIAYSRETWDCPVAFYTGSRYDSEAYAAMVQRLFELQEKWGVGVLDLWTDDAFNAIADSERRLYMNDRIHPTKAGYRDWWCPELERQLLRYFEAKE